MINNEQELDVTLERIEKLRSQIVEIRRVETNPINYKASASGFLAEIDRLQLQVWDFLASPASV